MTTSKAARHRHRAIASESRTYCYSGPVAQPENQAAHGNICVVDICGCGGRRATNRNQHHVERGPWQVAD